MRGFDPKWKGVPHDINGITKDVWEDRKIGSPRATAPGVSRLSGANTH